MSEIENLVVKGIVTTITSEATKKVGRLIRRGVKLVFESEDNQQIEISPENQKILENAEIDLPKNDGEELVIGGDENTVIGSNSSATGNKNTVVGANNQIQGDENTVVGTNRKITGRRNTIIG